MLAIYLSLNLSPLLQRLLLQLGESADQLTLRFRANLAFLEEHFPSVYYNVSDTEIISENYRTIYSENGEANLAIRLQNNDEIVYYSVYDPANEAAKWAIATAPQLIGKKERYFIWFRVWLSLKRTWFAQSRPSILCI
ncbi:hypothetical protein [Cohnella rhizosphaerae]|uniref:Uncharacterized protein n=1 Tax=Cohnella rhizosphaerae TaxID=1457232 RepID=A0A9X4QU43_9BACL|nr:hypothetical protein [Cohnella rhizosphaerae]MDG0811871.1 hypothetical protein [Cohnella rhizosphaerae]